MMKLLTSLLFSAVVVVAQQEPSPSFAFMDNFAPSSTPTTIAQGELGSDVPSLVPSITPSGASAAEVLGKSPQCADNELCAALGLQGACCPTIENWTLSCCGGPALPVEQQCELNPRCNDLGLEGACCPTIEPNGGNPAYLDCCTVLPDECINASTCNVTNSVTFKLALDQKKAAASSAMSVTGVAGSFIAMLMMAVVV